MAAQGRAGPGVAKHSKARFYGLHPGARPSIAWLTRAMRTVAKRSKARFIVEFRRVKKRGQNQKVQRTWLSADHYRLVWRREVWGVHVPAAFQATVRTIIPNYGGVEGMVFQLWDFTDRAHRLFKTRKAAEESCERHHRLWTKASEVTGIHGLIEIFGKQPISYPVWVRGKLNRKVYELLNRHQTVKYREDVEDDPTPTTPETPATPAMPVEPSKNEPPKKEHKKRERKESKALTAKRARPKGKKKVAKPRAPQGGVKR